MKASSITENFNPVVFEQPIREPVYAFANDKLVNGEHVPNATHALPLLPEGWVPRGWIWNNHIDEIVNLNYGYGISRHADLTHDIRYEVSPWCGEVKRSRAKPSRRMFSWLTEELSDLWNCDASGLARIICNYMQPSVWTHYLDLAEYWMSLKQQVETLDLILEYSLGPDKLKLMKCAPHTILEEDGWIVRPIIEANGMPIDAAKFSREEPLFITGLPYTALLVTPRIMKELNGSSGYSVARPPKIFILPSLVSSNAWLPNGLRRQVCTTSIQYSDGRRMIGGGLGGGDLCEITCDEPVIDWDFYCQICANDCIACESCKYLDPLFCEQHSSLVKQMQSGKMLCGSCMGPSRAP